MSIDRAAMFFAGFLMLVSPSFVGLNLTQASITGFCPAAKVFKLLGLRPGYAFR